jgi:hypothetical protein
VRLNISWVRQGQVSWSEDWVEGRGYTRGHIPGLADHISFANYDLAESGLPKIQKHSDGDLYIEFDPMEAVTLSQNEDSDQISNRAIKLIASIIADHGFDISEVHR